MLSQILLQALKSKGQTQPRQGNLPVSIQDLLAANPTERLPLRGNTVPMDADTIAHWSDSLNAPLREYAQRMAAEADKKKTEQFQKDKQLHDLLIRLGGRNITIQQIRDVQKIMRTMGAKQGKPQ